MRRVSDKMIIVAHRVDEEGLQKHLAVEIVMARSEMVLYKSLIPDNDIVRQLQQSGRKFIKLLDRFVFVLVNDNELQEAVFAEFFEYIANEYDHLIDISRNLENIETLLSELSGTLGGLADRCILDFGCGTGLGVGPLTACGASFVGADQSSHMRDLAQHRGMRAISIIELQNSVAAFHGVIASYVFHLLVDETVLDRLWATVKVGGVIVANFHKDRGVERVNSFFQRSDCRIVKREVLPHLQRHGSYFAYIKQ
jgi:SAM-dependent methyltransferase